MGQCALRLQGRNGKLASMDKIICLGKNYSEHAKEMGEVQPEKPVIFLKPPSVLMEIGDFQEPTELQYPQARGSLHHECEIVLKLGATNQIESVTLGLDMTLRDVQSDLKKRGQPWTISKVFRDSAVVGPWISVADFTDWKEKTFEFFLDGKIRQSSCAKEMLLKVEEIPGYLEKFFPLCQGDLIFTGTPAGVGAVSKGSLAQLRWGKIQYQVVWK